MWPQEDPSCAIPDLPFYRIPFVKGIIVIAPSLGFGGILLYSIYAQRASLNTTDSSLSLPFVTWYHSSRFLESRSPPKSPLAAPGSVDLLPGAGISFKPQIHFFFPYPSSSSSSRLRPPDRAAAGSSSSSVFHCRRRGLLIPVRGRRRGLLVPVRGSSRGRALPPPPWQPPPAPRARSGPSRAGSVPWGAGSRPWRPVTARRGWASPSPSASSSPFSPPVAASSPPPVAARRCCHPHPRPSAPALLCPSVRLSRTVRPFCCGCSATALFCCCSILLVACCCYYP